MKACGRRSVCEGYKWEIKMELFYVDISTGGIGNFVRCARVLVTGEEKWVWKVRERDGTELP